MKVKVLSELKNYKDEKAVQKTPKIIIVGLEDVYIDRNDEMFIVAIKEQNYIISDEFLVLRKYKNIGKGN